VELLKLLRLYFESSKSELVPAMLLKQLQVFHKIYFRMQQEDANELFMNFIDLIEKSLPMKDKIDNTFKQLIFTKITNTTECLKCEKKISYETQENNLFLNCDKSELKDCLIEYFSKNNVKSFCEHCKEETDKICYKKIKSLPQTLVLSLNRFDEKMRKKLNLVVFGNTIKINKITFKLKACIYHSGNSIDGGHYYTVIRKSDNCYINYNDNSVTKVKNHIDLINPNAYILFFERIEN
jgi:uncharacterized UBP type Zn finger protein